MKKPGFLSYVVVLLFNDEGNSVVLLQKDHPAWQKGKYNGPGGKVEPGETIQQAAAREMKEETGVDLPPERYEPFLLLEGEEYSAAFLRCFDRVAWMQATTMESEMVIRVPDHMIWHLPMIPNLRWIVPLAADRDLAVPIHIGDNFIAGQRKPQVTEEGEPIYGATFQAQDGVADPEPVIATNPEPEVTD